MSAIVELLYHHLLDNWHLAEGLLERDEYLEYQACRRFQDEQQAKLEDRLSDETAALLEAYRKNMEQVQDTECRLCFAGGLAMGLRLGGFADGR